MIWKGIVGSGASLGARRIVETDHIAVPDLPVRPAEGATYLLRSPNRSHGLTHGLFKFPAKFHVPVVSWALRTFASQGSWVLDPFTGSGTVQVEALRRGVNSVGVDIDPLSALIARVKTTCLEADSLDAVLGPVVHRLESWRRSRCEPLKEPGWDMSVRRYQSALADLPVPEIPNIDHWFRKHVIIDLGKIAAFLSSRQRSPNVMAFLWACFAAIIRRVSNADPYPVSGLEVTRHQKAKNVHRVIDVYGTYLAKLRVEVEAQKELREVVTSGVATVASAKVLPGDAVRLDTVLGSHARFPLVLSSPPYCRSVEYSRRHRLELFWLGLVDDREMYLDLKHRYVGRDYVRVGDWRDDCAFGIASLDKTIQAIRTMNPHHGRTVHHYFANMRTVLEQIRRVVAPNGRLVLVVGNSTCGGIHIDTASHLVNLSKTWFDLDYRFNYLIQNHYMQYGLWNGKGIGVEHVLVMKCR